MRKIQIKFIAVILTLTLSVSVVVASSYAWMVLSSSPAVAGIQVGIGGGNTVLIAPDIRVEAADGSVYHYPGRFTDHMNFHQQEAYEYLQELGHLNPVSTVNGVEWILPSYYSGSDIEVQQGRIPGGILKDITDFTVDRELRYANLSTEEEDKIDKGHYVYLDFWVAAPAEGYKLRVSTDVNALDGGSFVIDLPQPVPTESGYTLEAPAGSAASAVRVGFLANDLNVTDDTMAQYVSSPYFDDRYTHLKGFYQEPDAGYYMTIDGNRFTIYEPNGDAHPAYPEVDGLYVETKPLGLENGEIAEKQARSGREELLTVQRRSSWLTPTGTASATGSGDTALEQRFQTALAAGSPGGWDADKIADAFYGGYLQGQIAPYVKKGGFVSETENLYSALTTGKVSLEETATGINADAGATDDVYIIELERNVPQRIRMFIWLEGQDMDCIEQIASACFAVNIELACGDE